MAATSEELNDAFKANVYGKWATEKFCDNSVAPIDLDAQKKLSNLRFLAKKSFEGLSKEQREAIKKDIDLLIELRNDETKYRKINQVRDAKALLTHSNGVFITDGKHSEEISLEIANTQQSILNGLMFRKSLGKNEGMIFELPKLQKNSFWMKNTSIPLDIIFLDENFKVIGSVENATPHSEELLYPNTDLPCKYVVELNAGMVNRLGIKVGTSLKI